jgi:putative acetyltransferase
MGEVSLRPYRADDLEPAVDLWRRAWDAAMPEIDFSARLAWWRKRWTDELVPNNEIIVAEDAGKPIGFVVINKNSGYLDQIVVDPPLWGSETATRLLDRAKRICPGGIVLDVNQDNSRARRFYEREGFVWIGDGKNPLSGKQTCRCQWKP